MPVEKIRRRFAEDVNLYPEFGGPPKTSQRSEVVSIASTSSSTSSVAREPLTRVPKPFPLTKRSTVIISSDEEDDDDTKEDSESDSVVEIVPEPKELRTTPKTVITESASLDPLKRLDNIYNSSRPQPQPNSDFFSRPKTHTKPPPPQLKPQATPIHVPSNRDLIQPGFLKMPFSVPPPPIAVLPSHDEEDVTLPDFRDDNPFMTTREAETALRDLMSGSMNQDLDANIPIDMSEAKVDGFKDGIELLPHQIIGRSWMRDREDPTMKRFGGILADDMGLGKTIQTLTRISEGRPLKSDKQDWSASTLVVCPLALVAQWADEIQKMTNMKVLKHQGTNRTTDPNVLRRHHVVVTTYDTIKSEYMAYNPAAKDESKATSKSSKKKPTNDDDDDSESDSLGKSIKKKTTGKGRAPVKRCAIFEIKWWRIVLDEAHNIKNFKTKGAVACCELRGKYRWCLTGTPMQNNVTELYSLIKFLRIKPLSVWETFNEQVAKPVNGGRGPSRAMKRLQVVLQSIMLRRRKDQLLNGKPLLQLPKRFVNIVPCDFDDSEKDFYVSLETQMEGVIEKLMKNDNGGKNYISVLLLLLRLRQACNHPILVSKDYKNDQDALEPKAAEKGQDDADADAADDLIAAFDQLGVTSKCQMCTTELRAGNKGEGEWKNHCQDCVPLAMKAKKLELERPSSAKIRMILKLLKEIDERSESQEKTIVFSQFTSMLNLIQPFLEENGIKYVRYDGSMAPKDRETALEKIRTSESIRVILISFKAGSTGLNLTACNNVILVDLWWNPALEDQAFDRAHRFGQKRDVNIFKLKIDGTVEDRILLLQEKKRALAAAALSGDKIKDMRLGMEDLLALFRPGGKDDDEEDYD